MRIVDVKCAKTIPLGRLGENDYTLIRFDVSGWLAEYPDAVIGLYNQRPGDNSAYPVADLTVNGGVAEWQITNVELTQTGQGKCQLVAIKDSVVIKSMIYSTIVLDALDNSGDMPDPWDSWEDRFIELKGEAEQAASDAESAKNQILGMRAQAITLAPGSEATANYDDGVLTLGIPQGEQGAPGQDGAPGAKGDKGDKGDTGATGAQGQKGEKGDKGDKGDTGDQGQKGDKGDPGDPTELIDDNAGAGVTDKVWSASKSAGEVSDLLSALNVMNPEATSADIGKALLVKTVEDGKPTSWEYGEAGGGSVDPQDIAEAVDSWCDDNITNPDSPPLDRSLTSSSAAAPADMVGNIKSDVDTIAEAITTVVKSKNLIDTSKLTVGRLNSAGGVDANMTGYSTSDYIPVEAGKTYAFGNESHTTPGSLSLMGYSGYGFYNTSKTWIANSRVWDNYRSVTVLIQPSVDGYVRVSGGKDMFTGTAASFIVQEGSTLDGWEAYFDPYTDVIALTTDDIAQDFGQSTDKVISQKSITDTIGGIPNVTGRASLINLYDKSLFVVGKYIDSTGSIVSNATWGYTGFIPVTPNKQYNISIDPSSTTELYTIVRSFDSNGTFKGNIPLQSYVYSYLLSFVVPADIAYIVVMVNWTGHTESELTAMVDSIMLCHGTQRPAVYVPYNRETVLLYDKLNNSYYNPNVFEGKKWLALGTSITWYDSKKYQAGLNTDDICRGYVGNVVRRKPLIVTNEGISGSTLMGTSSSALINRYQSFDWANYDIATIEYGVNDFGNAFAIGTADDAPGTNTFAACLKTVIEYALTQNPKLCLVICTEPDVRGNTANSGGHYLYEYTDVTLAIAKQYRLPVCDWYYHSGINAVNKGSSSVDYMTADGTHPNDAGHLRMGAMLNQVFDSLIC